jgi:DNA-binding PadR family transcriptional regulator
MDPGEHSSNLLPLFPLPTAARPAILYYDIVIKPNGTMSLGDLQHMSMLAVARLGKDAYGARVRDELFEVGGRDVTVPTVYVTLIRLEEQGLVESEETPAEGSRGGRPRRVFRLTAVGWKALEAARISMAKMWEGVARP